MFNVISKELDPEVVIRTQAKERGRYDYDTGIVKGKFLRVKPETSKEVFAIQWMEHHVEKFAPARGEGILITVDAAEKWL